MTLDNLVGLGVSYVGIILVIAAPITLIIMGIILIVRKHKKAHS